ncbi:hypothetical protein LRAMOSA01270 [Lichtheimia ramosa]|uniref:Cytochrome b-c1 complex subunit 7 n=1 Tax=Lichtheimia ramosa TaxID=688394 RepID=A0A077WHS7_9FUNG|nr:hypothetical protein LRAMOSA01270 [Lichtheimia ramosa]
MSITLKNFVQNCKVLNGLVTPVANMYANAAGYRKIGLRYDDLISEENELVQEALRRLEIAEPHEMYERAYRIRVAQQCSLTHSLLPKEKWVTPATDKSYLRPYIDEVAAEFAERGQFDNIKVTPRH